MFFPLVENFDGHYRVFVYIPMHAPDWHPGSPHQCLRSHQVLSYWGLHSQQRQVFTPLQPYRNAVRPAWTVSGGGRADHLDHLPHLHERTFTAPVAQLPAPPTFRSGRLKHPLWFGSDRHWAWSLGKPTRGGVRRVSRGDPSRSICCGARKELPPWGRLQLLSSGWCRAMDQMVLGEGGSSPRSPWPQAALPQTSPARPAPRRLPRSEFRAAATVWRGPSGTGRRRMGGPLRPCPSRGTSAVVPRGYTQSGPTRRFW